MKQLLEKNMWKTKDGGLGFTELTGAALLAWVSLSGQDGQERCTCLGIHRESHGSVLIVCEMQSREVVAKNLAEKHVVWGWVPCKGSIIF